MFLLRPRREALQSPSRGHWPLRLRVTGQRQHDQKVNSVAVPQGVQVLQDSGAFNDACLLFRGQERHLPLMKRSRLTFKDALKRQEDHAEKFGYVDQIEARASYDVLIDETWTEDPRTPYPE